MSRKTRESKRSKNKEVIKEEDVVLYADMTNRLFASMLDLALLYMLVNVLSHMLFNAAYPQGSEYVRIHTQIVTEYPELASQPGNILLLIISKYPASMNMILNQLGFNAVVQIVLVGCYYIPMTKIYGATFGKMAMGMRVIDDITGKGISWSQSAVRYICYMPSIFVLGGGIFSGMVSRKKRCWHDIMADTYVIFIKDRWYRRLFDKLKAYFHLK